MRMILGMILGVVLTIGIAFISDTWSTDSRSSDTRSSGPATASAPTAVEHRKMVNWDVVGENLRVVRQHARDAWTTLAQKVTS